MHECESVQGVLGARDPHVLAKFAKSPQASKASDGSYIKVQWRQFVFPFMALGATLEATLELPRDTKPEATMANVHRIVFARRIAYQFSLSSRLELHRVHTLMSEESTVAQRAFAFASLSTFHELQSENLDGRKLTVTEPLKDLEVT